MVESRRPSFAGDGKELDVETWLFKVRTHFAAYPASEERQLAKAVNALDGPAAKWWRLETAEGTRTVSFAQLQQRITETFKPINAEQHAKDRIAAMRQTTSARADADSFRSAVLDIPTMGDEWKL